MFGPAEDPSGSLGSGGRKSDGVRIVEMPRCGFLCLDGGRWSFGSFCGCWQFRAVGCKRSVPAAVRLRPELTKVHFVNPDSNLTAAGTSRLHPTARNGPKPQNDPKGHRPPSRHRNPHLVISTIYTRSDLRSPDPKDPLGSSAGPNIPRRVEEIGGGAAEGGGVADHGAPPPPISSTRPGIFGPAEGPRGSLPSGGRKSDRV